MGGICLPSQHLIGVGRKIRIKIISGCTVHPQPEVCETLPLKNKSDGDALLQENTA
ncbi:hypothetical protein ACRRTK_016048 [Alexandromys fortis]